MESRQNTHIVQLLVWNTLSTTCDITSNLEVGQSTSEMWDHVKGQLMSKVMFQYKLLHHHLVRGHMPSHSEQTIILHEVKQLCGKNADCKGWMQTTWHASWGYTTPWNKDFRARCNFDLILLQEAAPCLCFYTQFCDRPGRNEPLYRHPQFPGLGCTLHLYLYFHCKRNCGFNFTNWCFETHMKITFLSKKHMYYIWFKYTSQNLFQNRTVHYM